VPPLRFLGSAVVQLAARRALSLTRALTPTRLADGSRRALRNEIPDSDVVQRRAGCAAKLFVQCLLGMLKCEMHVRRNAERRIDITEITRRVCGSK